GRSMSVEPGDDVEWRVDVMRILRLAEALVQATARVEPAARRRVHRAWDVALEDDPLAFPFRRRGGHRHRREQRPGVRVAGGGIEGLGRADLDDLAEVH